MTHFCLNRSVPEGFNNTFLESLKRDSKEGGNKEGESVQNIYRQILAAINESAAHCSEVFSGTFSAKPRVPMYEVYQKSQGIDSDLFKKIYAKISKLVEKREADDFDKKIKELYKWAVNYWREDLTMDDVGRMAVEFVKKVDVILEKEGE